MGTFAGRRPTQSGKVFLFVGDGGPRDVTIRQGFEERLSALGAVSIALLREDAVLQRRDGQLPQIDGTWDTRFESTSIIPTVGLLGKVDPASCDSVFFDDVQGGNIAVQHLLAFGCRSAIFLGVHVVGAPYGALDWSERRANGFRQAMTSVGLGAAATVLLPTSVMPISRPLEPWDYFGMGASLARQLDYTEPNLGIVAANDRVAFGFIAAALSAGVPPDRIPPVIGFDNLPSKFGNHLSSMALPWAELGRTAADVVFRRVNGTLQGDPVSEVVSMIPITRLSSRRAWLPLAPRLLAALQRNPVEADLF
jgi:DNA-binding LacI/PurR family transcriptional regulator